MQRIAASASQAALMMAMLVLCQISVTDVPWMAHTVDQTVGIGALLWSRLSGLTAYKPLGPVLFVLLPCQQWTSPTSLQTNASDGRDPNPKPTFSSAELNPGSGLILSLWCMLSCRLSYQLGTLKT